MAADALMAAVNVADDAVYIADANGTITFANRALARILRAPVETIVGQSTRIFRSGVMSPAYYVRLWRTVTRGEVWRETITNRRTDGELYEAAQTITPVAGGDGRIGHFIAVQRDLSEAHAVENERERVTVELERILALRETLLSEITHRVKNDFAVARAALELQATRIADPEARDAVEKAAYRLAVNGRIYDLLQTQRDDRLVDLSLFMADLVSWWRGTRESIGFSVVVSASVPLVPQPLAVTVGLVAHELVTNSAKYAEGAETPQVSLAFDSSGHELTMRVADSGSGFPQAVLDGARSGHGLTIARAMVRRYDGALRLANDRGAVAEVALRLPPSV